MSINYHFNKVYKLSSLTPKNSWVALASPTPSYLFLILHSPLVHYSTKVLASGFSTSRVAIGRIHVCFRWLAKKSKIRNSPNRARSRNMSLTSRTWWTGTLQFISACSPQNNSSAAHHRSVKEQAHRPGCAARGRHTISSVIANQSPIRHFPHCWLADLRLGRVHACCPPGCSDFGVLPRAADGTEEALTWSRTVLHR